MSIIYLTIFSFSAALEFAITKCVNGADISTVCGEVDAFIVDELAKTFSNKKSKKLERGIAFPTCISVNQICGHYSPCPDDSSSLKTEDLVKIDYIFDWSDAVVNQPLVFHDVSKSPHTPPPSIGWTFPITNKGTLNRYGGIETNVSFLIHHKIFLHDHQ